MHQVWVPARPCRDCAHHCLVITPDCPCQCFPHTADGPCQCFPHTADGPCQCFPHTADAITILECFSPSFVQDSWNHLLNWLRCHEMTSIYLGPQRSRWRGVPLNVDILRTTLGGGGGTPRNPGDLSWRNRPNSATRIPLPDVVQSIPVCPRWH